eukprot:2783109-Rhodomonas_salina.1
MPCCCLYASSYCGRGHPLYQRTRVLSCGHCATGGYKGPWYHCTMRVPVDSLYVSGELIARTSAGTVLAKLYAIPWVKNTAGDCCMQSARVTCQNRVRIKGTAAFRRGSAYWRQGLLREAGQKALDLPGATERGLLCTAVSAPGAITINK